MKNLLTTLLFTALLVPAISTTHIAAGGFGEGMAGGMVGGLLTTAITQPRGGGGNTSALSNEINQLRTAVQQDLQRLNDELKAQREKNEKLRERISKLEWTVESLKAK